jgi:hypothetical protein
MAIDDQDKQIAELQKTLKKQAKQISVIIIMRIEFHNFKQTFCFKDITLELEASQRHYTDVNEILAQNQKRCQNLVTEVEEMRSSLEKVF